jgi:hypothetical protein
MMLPLLGEVTMMRAFFLFLFFYSNDSNSLGTWSTFGAGMLLSNLGVHLPARVPRPYFHVLEREGTARPGSETAWLWVSGYRAPVRAFVRACSRVCGLCGLAGGQASVTLFFAVGPRRKAASLDATCASLEATRGVKRYSLVALCSGARTAAPSRKNCTLAFSLCVEPDAM